MIENYPTLTTYNEHKAHSGEQKIGVMLLLSTRQENTLDTLADFDWGANRWNEDVPQM